MCQNKLRNARILLKKILKVIFRLALLSTGLSLRFFCKNEEEKDMPTASSVPRRSPIQVLTGLDAA